MKVIPIDAHIISAEKAEDDGIRAAAFEFARNLEDGKGVQESAQITRGKYPWSVHNMADLFTNGVDK